MSQVFAMTSGEIFSFSPTFLAGHQMLVLAAPSAVSLLRENQQEDNEDPCSPSKGQNVNKCTALLGGGGVVRCPFAKPCLDGLFSPLRTSI